MVGWTGFQEGSERCAGCFLGGWGVQGREGSLSMLPHTPSWEQLTVVRNQVPMSWSRNSLTVQIPGCFSFGPPGRGSSTLLLKPAREGDKICHLFSRGLCRSHPMPRVGPLASGPSADSRQKVNLEQTVFRAAGNSVCPEGSDCQ